MKKAILLVLLSFFQNYAFAEPTDAFIEHYISVNNEKLVEEFERMVHPESFAYFKRIGKENFVKNSFLAFRERRGVIPEDAKIDIVKLNSETRSGLKHPVDPSHRVSISWNIGGSGKGSSFGVVEVDGTWMIVYPKLPGRD